MRPDRLTLTAFGPYAGRQMIDFAALGVQRLFLITGPTGAGKTSVLDGLCYALFGESSGAERTDAHLRSQHAEPGQETSAELDFALGEALYRIRRNPAQPRPGRSSAIPAEAVLWRLTTTGPVVLADKVRAVNEAVHGLLGYRAEEFRQVVVLPQGRFRELLTAAPGERQSILRTLFRTTLYQRIEAGLKRTTAEAEQSLRVQDAIRLRSLADLGAESLAAAEALRQGVALRVAEAQGRAEAARAAEAAAAARKREGDEAQARLTALAQTRERVAHLAAQAPQAEAMRARLALAARAAGLAAEGATALAAREAATRAAREAAEAATAAERSAAGFARATAALQAAEAGEATAQARLEQAKALRALAETARRAAAINQEVQAAAAAHGLAARAAAGARAKAEAAATQAAAAAATRAATAEAAAQAERHRLVIAAGSSLARDAADLSGLAEAHRRHTAAQARAAQAQLAADRRVAAARTALAEAETNWRADAAHALASGLAKGAPCPVCGSTHHPTPARASGNAVPDLSLLRREEAGALAEQAEAREAYAAARAETAATEARRQQLAGRAGAGAGPDAAPLASSLAAARAALPAAEAAQRALPDLTRATERAASLAAATRDAAAQAEAALNAAALRRAGAEAAARERAGDLPPEAADPAALILRAEAAEQAGRAALDALRSGRDVSAAAGRAASAGAARAETTAAEAARLATAALAAQSGLDGAAQAAGFADAAALAEASLPAAEAEAMRRNLDAYGQAMAVAEAMQAEAMTRAEGLSPPDLPALDLAARIAAGAAQAASAEAAMAGNDLGRMDEGLARLRKAEAELILARQAFETRKSLSDLTAGQNPQRLSLEGFVLKSLLEESLAAANRRLSGMLGGRYRLRAREEPERRNAAVGLDLEVQDDWTGTLRPAATLSGGEGFCASLALALGLADTVQAHAGARRIDALFIDEGFGTLDAESLDTAMEVLMSLPGRDRLVGVVSHVDSLRDRIPARLEVTPGRRGSTAVFRFG